MVSYQPQCPWWLCTSTVCLRPSHASSSVYLYPGQATVLVHWIIPSSTQILAPTVASQWPKQTQKPPRPALVTSLRKRSETFQFIICLDATLSGMLTFSKLPTSAPFETCLVWRHQHIYIWSLIYLQWLGECLQQEAQESTERLEPPCSHCGCRRFNAPHTLSLTSI